MELDAHEQRVLGCLIEKRRTTPDTYPLSLNGLRTACNQATNRDPVMALTDEDVRAACTALHHKGLVRITAAGEGSRTTKYRHTANEALAATDEELALLSVMLVREPQTLSSLRSRTERLHPFGSLDEVADTLDDLGRRGLITVLDREPGRKEDRYTHQLGPRDPELAAAAEAIAAEHRAQLIADGLLPGSPDEDSADLRSPDEEAPAPTSAAPAPAPPAAAPVPAAPPGPGVAELLARIEALERRVEELEELISS